MRILLDECVDRRVAGLINGHEVVTVTQAGWAGMTNGALLKAAAPEFDVFLTVDRNLSFQQHLSSFNIAVMVLRARTNRIEDIQVLLPLLMTQLENPERGKAVLIG